MEGGDKEKKRTNRQQSNRNLTKKKKGTRSRLARHVWADERLAAIQQGAQKDERLTGVSGDSGDSEESRDVPERERQVELTTTTRDERGGGSDKEIEKQQVEAQIAGSGGWGGEGVEGVEGLGAVATGGE